MEPVGNAELRHTTDTVVHHIARARHHKAHVRHACQNLGCRLDKVVGTLLEGDTAEERNDLILHATLRCRVVVLGKMHCIVHCHNLLWLDVILVNNDVTC